MYIILILMSAILVACDTPFNPIPNERNYYNNLVFAEDVLSQTHASSDNPETTHGTTIYLSDIQWVNAMGPPGGHYSPKKDLTVVNTPLTVDGTTYQKGLGTHTPSTIVYHLEKRFHEFKAVIGIDDLIADPTEHDPTVVLFEVLGDGTSLYRSAILNSASPAQDITVNIAGINTLTLITHRPANIRHDSVFANWADARVTTKTLFREYASEIPWDQVETGYGVTRRNRSISNTTLKLKGKEYEKGIGTHAESTIVINLNEDALIFRADIGIDDNVSDGIEDVSVTFEIYLDNERAYVSPSLTPISDTISVDIFLIKRDKTLAQSITLKVLDDGNNRHDHANWADARLYTFHPLPVIDLTPPKPDLTFSTSDSELDQAFEKLKSLAASYVTTKGSGLIPAIEGALQTRGSFALRDTTHMAIGAHYLGFDVQMLSMFTEFAEETKNRHDKAKTECANYQPGRRCNLTYFFPWHILLNGNLVDSAHQVPAVYDFVRTAYIMYRLTDDATWITRPSLFNQYTHIMTQYLDEHNTFIPNNRFADAEGGHFGDTPTFYEMNEFIVNEAADGIGMQYQASLAYARILESRGTPYARWDATANDIRDNFRSDFQDGSSYYAGRVFRDEGPDGQKGTEDDILEYLGKWKREASILMPATFLTEPGIKTDEYLNLIQQNYKNINVEAQTYVPEAFYPYGKTEDGWEILEHLINTHSNYPEVPYTIIGNTIRYVIGLDRDTNDVLHTLPQLPSKLRYFEVAQIPIGMHTVTVRHEGNNHTTFENHNENATINWEPRFIGTYASAEKTSSSSSGNTIISGQVRRIHGVDITVFPVISVRPMERITVRIR